MKLHPSPAGGRAVHQAPTDPADPGGFSKTTTTNQTRTPTFKGACPMKPQERSRLAAANRLNQLIHEHEHHDAPPSITQHAITAVDAIAAYVIEAIKEQALQPKPEDQKPR